MPTTGAGGKEAWDGGRAGKRKQRRQQQRREQRPRGTSPAPIHHRNTITASAVESGLAPPLAVEWNGTHRSQGH